MQPRAVSFEEQATIIREKLADLLVEDDEFSAAARILAGIDLESGMRQVTIEHHRALGSSMRNDHFGPGYICAEYLVVQVLNQFGSQWDVYGI